MRMAIHSARSAKRLMPNVETVLITDLKVQKAPCFDIMIQEEPVDLVNAHLAPLWLLPEGYDSGLYTGADSYFCRSVEDVFELVEDKQTDLALVHTSGKPRETKYPSPGVPEAWPHWGDALLCFNVHAQMRKFFTDYRETFLKHVKEHRQAALWEYAIRGSLRAGRHQDDHNAQNPTTGSTGRGSQPTRSLPTIFQRRENRPILEGVNRYESRLRLRGR